MTAEDYENEVNALLAMHADDRDPEAFHAESDGLIAAGLAMIVAGTDDPGCVASAALKLARSELTRWYA